MGHRISQRSLLLAFAATLLMAAGCSSGEEKSGDKKKNPNLPPARVELPDKPPASALKIPEKNDDGTFRVRGLIAHRAKHLDETVEITGTITYISPDCDPSEAKEKGEECPEPYMFIKDKKEADDKMMVVGHDKEFLEEADLETGQDFVFKGKYKKVAQGFVASENGLLLVDKIGDMDVLKEEE